MEPKEAAAACAKAAAALALAMTKTTDRDALRALVEGLAAVAARMEPKEAAAACAKAAAALALAMTKTTDRDALGRLTQGLSAVLSREDALRPLPAQLLVDLLKHPLFVGEARRVVLEQLARRYRRPFADQWEFVRFAKEKKLGLDFTTPPRRPGSPAAGR
jgi:hypothetical protein